ncbi:MAG: hypothetical protein ACRENA_03080 [Vulcanimicrobiaceae bacterium]
MAIRPVDLQATILQTTQTASVQRQAEVAAPTAASINGQQFAAKVEERSETVQETDHGRGNRVEEKGSPDQQEPRGKKRQGRQPGQPFEGIEEDLPMAADGDHLIDFTA